MKPGTIIHGFSYGYGGVPAPTVEADLLETTDEEKLEAGLILKERESVMEGWERLKQRGYTLAKVKQ